MKKGRIICSAIAVFILIALCLIWNKARYKNVMEDINLSTVDKVIIYNPAENISITQQEDICNILQVLQSMNLKKSFPVSKDGYAFLIEIYHVDGKVTSIVMTSEYLVINDIFYKCERDYCEDVRKLYDEFRRK